MTSDPLVRYLTQRTAKMDRRNRLRLMSGNEVVETAIRVYQVMGWTFLKLTVVPTLFCLAAVTFLFDYVLPAYFETSHPGSASAQMVEMVSTTCLALFVATPLFLLGISYTSVLVTTLVSDYMVGNAPSAQAADARARSLVPKLFLLALRIIVISFGGFLVAMALLALAGYLGNATAQTDATAAIVLILAVLAFVAATVVFLIVVQRTALAPAVLVLENVGIVSATKRSAQLLKAAGPHGSGGGTVWSLYVLLLLLLLPVWGGIAASLDLFGYPENIKGYLAGMPFAGVIVEVLGLLPMFLVLWTLTPVWAATTTILYYDRRMRLEGYDIEALAEDVWRADRSRRFEL